MPFAANSALSGIIHPGLHESLQKAYPAWVTVQEAVETQGDDYSVEQTWQDVTGLRGLRGILANGVGGRGEWRRPEMTVVEYSHVLDLQSYHPEITEQNRVIVSREQGEGGTIFNIVAAKHDSQAASTRLELELVSF